MSTPAIVVRPLSAERLGEFLAFFFSREGAPCPHS